MQTRFLYVITFICVFLINYPLYALTVVPPGNRSTTQPEIPRDAKIRTSQTGETFQSKYEKVIRLFQKDRKLIRKIKKIATHYDIDPVHIIAAIVGEHTYNVDAVDQLQSYYVKALAYADTKIRFAYNGESVTDFVQRPEFAVCKKLNSSYEVWTCREMVWETQFRHRSVHGINYPNQSFGKTFFQPLFAGQTFGLGQLNPLTALMMNDLVRERGRQRKLDVRRANQVYKAIMDPDQSLHFIAAVLKTAIDDYAQITGFDISQNPGITATLYNLGGSRVRAENLFRENQRRQAAGETLKWPQENYYGWLVNDKIEVLRSLLE